MIVLWFTLLSLLVIGAGFGGWYLRGRSASDTMNAAGVSVEMAGRSAERVLEAAKVITKVDGLLESVLKQSAENHRVMDSIDRQQGSILTYLLNSGMARRLEDELQVGQGRRSDPDEVPPPFKDVKRSAPGEPGAENTAVMT